MSNNLNRQELIEDMPQGGPLASYRLQASFDWKKMKLFFEEEKAIEYKANIWRTLRNDSLFTRDIDELSSAKKKELTDKRVKRLAEYAFLTDEDTYDLPLKRMLFDEAIVMWDIDASVKYSLHYQMFKELLKYMGTERHHDLMEKCSNLQAYGCFALTEMSHGSNTKETKTRADYDVNTQEFIINTPSIEDCKIWVGNLGKTATHAAVYAQLYTPDGVCHGLHIFIVPIRDPHTMYALPGITVGDMGEKAGLNGVDNGFAIFNQVRIPRENLLNKTGDVTPDGRYVSPYKDPKKRFGISLGALSNGRVGLTFYAHGFMSQCLAIAIRYAAIRKQFGPSVGNEQPIIEYQLHQYRLMPLLATCFVWKNFSSNFFNSLAEFLIGLMSRDTSDRQADLGKEIHIISCASKPVSSWASQQCIQECREACGGHGYMRSARFAEFRNNNDPLLTFEGDNNVLLQQTSNYLLSAYEEYLTNGKIPETPLESLSFINRIGSLKTRKRLFHARNELESAIMLMEMFDWLVGYLLKSSYEKYESLLALKIDPFEAKNNTQVFYMKTLSMAFIERTIVDHFVKKIQQNEESSLGPVLNRILFLAGYHLIDKYLVYFYQGGYFTDAKSGEQIRDLILNLCLELKHDSIALIDSLAPPDYVLNSCLGNSDGLVYKHLYNSMIQSNGCFQRLSWFNDFMNKKDFASKRDVIAKL